MSSFRSTSSALFDSRIPSLVYQLVTGVDDVFGSTLGVSPLSWKCPSIGPKESGIQRLPSVKSYGKGSLVLLSTYGVGSGRSPYRTDLSTGNLVGGSVVSPYTTPMVVTERGPPTGPYTGCRGLVDPPLSSQSPYRLRRRFSTETLLLPAVLNGEGVPLSQFRGKSSSVPHIDKYKRCITFPGPRKQRRTTVEGRLVTVGILLVCG